MRERTKSPGKLVARLDARWTAPEELATATRGARAVMAGRDGMVKLEEGL